MKNLFTAALKLLGILRLIDWLQILPTLFSAKPGSLEQTMAVVYCILDAVAAYLLFFRSEQIADWLRVGDESTNLLKKPILTAAFTFFGVTLIIGAAAGLLSFAALPSGHKSITQLVYTIFNALVGFGLLFQTSKVIGWLKLDADDRRSSVSEASILRTGFILLGAFLFVKMFPASFLTTATFAMMRPGESLGADSLDIAFIFLSLSLPLSLVFFADQLTALLRKGK